MSHNTDKEQMTFAEIAQKNQKKTDQQGEKSSGEKKEVTNESNEKKGDETSKFKVPNELFREYLEQKTGVKLAQKTAEGYDSTLTLFCEFLETQDSTVLDADFDDLMTYVEEMTRVGLAQETGRNKLSALKQAYKYINLRTDNDPTLRTGHFEEAMGELSDYNWSDGVDREALDKDEVRKLYEVANKRNEIIIRVIIGTALRNSDVRNIKLEHLQFDNEDPTIYVPDSKNDDSYEVPVTHELAFKIERYIQLYRESGDSDYLFPGARDSKLETNEGFNSSLKDIAKEAGIQGVIGKSPLRYRQKEVMNTDKDFREWKRVIVHVLRRTALTHMVDAGVPEEIARYVANHDHLETLKRYLDEEKIVDHDTFRDNYNPP